MLHAIKSESIKLVSLRSAYVYAFLLLASILAINIGGLFFVEKGTVIDFEDIATGGPLFLLISLVFIGNSVGAAHSDRMNAQAFLTQKHRYNWLFAYTLVAGGFLLALGAVAIGLSTAVIALFPGVELATTNAQFVGMLALQVVIYGIVAGALGVLTRSRVAASVVPLALLLVIEPLVKMAATSIDAFRPLWLILGVVERIHQLGNSWAGISDGPTGWTLDTVQPVWFNVALPLAWVLIFAIGAFLANQRCDIR